jgi:hypothetical protein
MALPGLTLYVALDPVGVNDPITFVGVEPPILYCTLTFGEPPLLLNCDLMLIADNVNVVLASEVIEIKYHLELLMLLASDPLKPLPLIPVLAELQVTPLPRDI